MHPHAEASGLDRCENERLDAAWLVERWTAPDSLLIVVGAAGRISVAGDGTAPAGLRPAGEFDPQRHYLLGLLAGRAVFVTAGETEPMAGLRDLLPDTDEVSRELVTGAVALANWHRTLPHCGMCGSPTQVRAGGMVRHCPACGRDRFPRSDPAVIVAVLDASDRLLLGHQVSWPRGRMSLLAGFVTAGESLEQTVHREVAEESGLALSSVRYVGSQPWPFPRSLMIGFVARATDTAVEVDGVEIESAAWFTREQLTSAVDIGEVSLPGAASIAHRIIGQWRADTLPVPEDD